MKEKNLKLIMELIFIFILPLAFILPNVKINNVYTYDTSGNFETSEKELSFTTPFSFIKDDEYINYLDFNQFIINGNFVDTDNWNVTYNASFNVSDNVAVVGATQTYSSISSNYIDFINGHKYLLFFDYSYTISQWGFYSISGTTWVLNKTYLSANDGSNHTYYCFFTSSYDLSARVSFQYDGSNFTDNYIYLSNVMLIDLTQMFGSSYEPSSSTDLNIYIDLSSYYEFTDSSELLYYSDDIVSSNYVVNYTIWGKIKLLFSNFLDIGESSVFDLFMSYIVLWILMFIVWHLVYTSLDFIVHLLKIRKRE